jgi:hypothetical protein
MPTGCHTDKACTLSAGGSACVRYTNVWHPLFSPSLMKLVCEAPLYHTAFAVIPLIVQIKSGHMHCFAPGNTQPARLLPEHSLDCVPYAAMHVRIMSSWPSMLAMNLSCSLGSDFPSCLLTHPRLCRRQSGRPHTILLKEAQHPAIGK